MAKIALSVSSDYLPNWAVYEGLRELVQNFIDSQDDSGVKGEISFLGGSARGTVRLVNHGAKPLTREALLFGVTSKANREDQRGQFGEGMKVGCLALVRAGRSVTIRTQTETWVASLQPSPEFGNRKVLTFETRKRSTETDSVEVEIGPVERSEWEEIQSSFMFMQEDLGNVDSIRGYSGAILRGDTHRNRVFAKGIFVRQMESMRWGYDLADLNLNRDRSMVDEYDVRSRVVSVLNEQYREGNLSISDIMSLFRDNNWEAQTGWAWQYCSVTNDIVKHLAAENAGRGRGMIFTANEDEAVKAESFGWVAVRVPKSLYDASRHLFSDEKQAEFRKKHGISTFGEMLIQMRDSIDTEWAREDLEIEEISNLEWAEGILSRIGVSVNATVVKFVREGELMGLFKGGLIYIGRGILSDRMETLGTLIHEYSHNWGTDGSLEHSQMIEAHWVKVARVLAG